MKGDKIKRTAGHGINYYFDTKHGFDEMIAKINRDISIFKVPEKTTSKVVQKTLAS